MVFLKKIKEFLLVETPEQAVDINFSLYQAAGRTVFQKPDAEPENRPPRSGCAERKPTAPPATGFFAGGAHGGEITKRIRPPCCAVVGVPVARGQASRAPAHAGRRGVSCRRRHGCRHRFLRAHQPPLGDDDPLSPCKATNVQICSFLLFGQYYLFLGLRTIVPLDEKL